MKKISKRFLFIVLMILTAGSITFGSFSISDNIKLNNQIEQLEQDISSKDKKIEDLVMENDKYTQDINALQSQVAEKDSKINELNENITKLNGEITSLRKK